MARPILGKTGRVALCAMLTALSAALLFAASVLPSGRWGLAAAAGLAPAAAAVSVGLGYGALTWAAGAALGLLLVPDKGLALLYLLFFGLYPIVKCLIERLRKLPLEILCKISFFAGILTVVLFGFKALFPFFTWEPWLCYVAGSAVFLVYDYGFSKLIQLFAQRLNGGRKQH